MRIASSAGREEGRRRRGTQHHGSLVEECVELTLHQLIHLLDFGEHRSWRGRSHERTGHGRSTTAHVEGRRGTTVGGGGAGSTSVLEAEDMSVGGTKDGEGGKGIRELHC